MKKHLTTSIMLMALLTLAILLSGCGSKSGKASDDLKVDFCRTIYDSGDIRETIAFVVTNTSDKAATDIWIDIIPYDSDGNIIAYGEDDPGTADGAFGSAKTSCEIPCIMPGEKCGMIAFGFDDLKELPDHIDVKVAKANFRDPAKIEGGDVILEDYSYDFGSEHIDLTLKNETEYDYDISDPLGKHILNAIIIAYDEDGNIVGGTSSTINQRLGAGEELTTTEIVETESLSGISAASTEVFLYRYDDDGKYLTTYYDEDGNAYTEEEYIQYLKDTGQYEG